MRLGERDRLTIDIPLLPPSVNHYISHPAAGIHCKTPEAKAFERDFPIFARGAYVVSQSGRFAVMLEFWPGPGNSGDIDNRNKLPLDCLAKSGALRDGKGKERSDAWIKRLVVVIKDSPEERVQGPKMRITAEPYEAGTL